MRSPILRAIDVPCLFTLGGLMAAFASALAAINHAFGLGMLALVAAGAVDFFDGWLARRLSPDGTRSPMSRALDTVADVCSFGLAPAVFGYCWGLASWGELALLGAYLACNALRLAYFSSTPPLVIDGQRYYLGMPVTYVALFLPWVFLATYGLPAGTARIALDGCYAALAVAMVAGVPVRKPVGVWYGVYTALGLVPVAVIGTHLLWGR